VGIGLVRGWRVSSDEQLVSPTSSQMAAPPVTPFGGTMVAGRRTPRFRRAGIILGICLVIAQFGLVGFEVESPTASVGEGRAIELSAINVTFDGSGSGNATLSSNASPCGASFVVGLHVSDGFVVLVPFFPGTTCDAARHTYAITQLASPGSGAFRVEGDSWGYANSRASPAPFPALVPGCLNAFGPIYSVESFVSLLVVNAAASNQTLSLVVTVDQIS
jgi:hypothetical protein